MLASFASLWEFEEAPNWIVCVPDPIPPPGALMLSQVRSVDVACHVQPVVVLTVTLPVPPKFAKFDEPTDKE